MAEPLTPGDPWPKLTLAGAEGEAIDLSHQTRAGRTTLVALAPEARLDAIASALAGHIAPAAEIALWLIAKAAPPGAAPEKDTAPAHALRLYAPRELGPELTGRAEALILLDRLGRIRAIEPLEAIEALSDAARALEAEAAAAFAPVLLLPGILEPMLCERIIAYWEGEPKFVNAVAARRAGNASINPDFKRRSDVVLKDSDLLKQVTRRIGRRLIPEVRKYLRARLIESEAFRIGCYDSADLGAFKRHRDNTTPHTNHRAFAMSLNLNDPASYEGGAIRFPEFGDRLYRPTLGGAVIFSCGLLHEALPVTAGRRFGMFTFFADEEGAKVIAAKRGDAQRAGEEP